MKWETQIVSEFNFMWLKWLIGKYRNGFINVESEILLQKLDDFQKLNVEWFLML